MRKRQSSLSLRGPLSILGGGAALGMTGAVMAGTFGPGPNSITLSTGQDLSIVITQPPDGSTVPIPPGTVTVQGQATVGGFAGAATNVLYVIDVSGSTGSIAGDCNGDGVVNAADNFNNSGANGEVLDCEIAGVIALNASLFGLSNVEVGLVSFQSSATVRDVDPVAAGVQAFTSPLDVDRDANGVPDLEQVARSLSAGGGTDFDPPISAINSAFGGQPSGDTNVAFFLSDGQGFLSTGPGSPLQAAADAGTVINTFSVGPFATGCGQDAFGNPTELQEIADTTGGTCTEVLDPTDLSTTLPGVTPGLLDRVEVEGVEVPTDALGNFTTDVSCPGPTSDFEVTATAFANDPNDPNDPNDDAEVSVSADVQLVCQSGPVVQSCDINQDASIDRTDIGSIFAARGTVPTNATDPRDFDGDGLITVNDARACALQCTNAQCAP